MNAQEEASMMLGGSDDESAPRKPQQLSGSGTTESHNSTALERNAMACLYVAATSAPVRMSLRGTSGASGQVDGDERVLGAGQSMRWLAQDTTQHVYIEAEDGSSSYEAHVWTCGPGQG